MSKNILILGATSSIARAMALEFAAQGHNLFLASRDSTELAKIATDLTIRYKVHVVYNTFIAGDFSNHESFLQEALTKMQTIDGVVLAFGSLGDLTKMGQFSNDQEVITDNFTGAVSILNLCSDYFVTKKQGFIIALSSVAGERGRQSNYIYGAAKSALTVYLQGLRNKLHSSGIKILTVKLGFVDTPMTFGKPRLFCVAKPSTVAKKIIAVMDHRDVIYLPWFWRFIMALVKALPEKIFKRLQV